MVAGIGTYTTNSKDSVNESPFGKIKSWFTRLIDQGFGTSLDSHVIAGYRFLMRYYTVGDEIYMFGFSRGAFTARFLASMIYHVGILSKGNEEMIPFAYKTYQDHELGGARSDPMKEDRLMKEFRETFCLGKVQVHFLGLFDTVRSVGTFDAGGAKIPVSRTFAKFTRHAVALDERRSKFKAALLCQNTSGTHTAHVTPENPSQLDIYTRERWFPGNHGDVGGGWPREENALALSDIALGWMLREIQELPAEQCIAGPLNLNMEKVTKFETQLSNRKEDALLSKEHDVLRFGRGVSWFKVIMWNILGMCIILLQYFVHLLKFHPISTENITLLILENNQNTHLSPRVLSLIKTMNGSVSDGDPIVEAGEICLSVLS